jgi:hypothetical protein
MREVSPGVDPSSRKVIDEAVGILIGWRGCTEREAFDEIAQAVRDTGVGVGSIARALVALASGAVDSDPHGQDARRVWGDAMPLRQPANR